MTRKEFFQAIYTKFSRFYKLAIFGCTALIVALRIWNTEAALTLAIAPLTLCAPVFFILPFAMRERIFELWERHTQKRKRPFFITIELFPYAVFVALITILPPYLITEIIFGFENSESQHTQVLTALCCLFLLSVHFYWIIDPRLKRKQQSYLRTYL